jgi:uncharacterized protein (DUF433 family)
MILPDFLSRDAAGEIRLAGHRVGLYHVVRLHHDGFSERMIADYFPSLSLDLVSRVVGFYEANAAAVDAYVAAERAELDRQAALPQPGPSADDLRRRMAARLPKGA